MNLLGGQINYFVLGLLQRWVPELIASPVIGFASPNLPTNNNYSNTNYNIIITTNNINFIVNSNT